MLTNEREFGEKYKNKNKFPQFLETGTGMHEV